jgi:hypothetical protein
MLAGGYPDLGAKRDDEPLSRLERAEASHAVVHALDDALHLLALLVDSDNVLLWPGMRVSADKGL